MGGSFLHSSEGDGLFLAFVYYITETASWALGCILRTESIAVLAKKRAFKKKDRGNLWTMYNISTSLTQMAVKTF